MASKNDRDKLMNDEQGVFQHLMQDHRKVEQLLDQAIAGGDGEDMAELLRKVKLEVMLHTNVEDRVVYAALEEYDELADDIEHNRDEHQEAEAILLELDEMDVQDPDLTAKLEELRDAVTSHIQEEEKKTLPKAADLVDQKLARELGRRYEQEKEPERQTLLETEPGLEAEAGEAGAERGP